MRTEQNTKLGWQTRFCRNCGESSSEGLESETGVWIRTVRREEKLCRQTLNAVLQYIPSPKILAKLLPTCRYGNG